MKTTATDEQIKIILAALQRLHLKPFCQESCDTKHNAQRNLSGKTHYVDDDTLRWHKSRVLSSGHLHGGLLFRITTSDALDIHNTRRGFRAVVFDVFGTTIYRPKLEEAFSTSHAAYKASEKQEIDLVTHYREAIASELRHRQQAVIEYSEALAMLPDAESKHEAA